MPLPGGENSQPARSGSHEADLPVYFTTGGLPNTAIARIPLESTQTPQQVFRNIVDEIWMKTARVSAHAPQEEVRQE